MKGEKNEKENEKGRERGVKVKDEVRKTQIERKEKGGESLVDLFFLSAFLTLFFAQLCHRYSRSL